MRQCPFKSTCKENNHLTSRDTTNFPLKLQSTYPVPPNALVVTHYVKMLYLNILYNEGLAACRAALENWEIVQPPTEA